ncbi:MAG: ABC transporter ATP-binding protein [Planctomycetota bacterium]|nr:ABC transporter ATP-binding protein [Planctomycetota bacterium]
MIGVKNIRFSYGEKNLLDGVSFDVCDGEVVALAGPNSVGKTTLLRIIIGLIKPQDGSVLIDGKDIKSLKDWQKMKSLAVVPQSPLKPERMSVLETVLLGRASSGFSFDSEEDVKVATDALRHTNALHLAHRDLATLSGGEWQRVLLARALAQGAKNLLLDEPTTHLDIAHQIEVMEILRSLKNDRKAVLWVAHEINLAALYADRILLLSKGRIIADGRPKDVLTAENLKVVYGVEVCLVEHNGGFLVVPKKN